MEEFNKGNIFSARRFPQAGGRIGLHSSVCMQARDARAAMQNIEALASAVCGAKM